MVNGIVQGVGFRPFVYNLARRLNLSGFISNNSNGVEIEVEGAAQNAANFIDRLKDEAPPLSEIIEISTATIPTQNDDTFIIKKSRDNSDNQTLISPDTSVCDDCLRELFDKNDRRYLYPFINCTNCGPRFTIIRKVPYDRPFTTMAPFKLCTACQEEYNNPENRRFHAQPNACPDCGPRVFYEDQKSNEILHDEAAIIKTAERLKAGKIIAVKGLGGFHLAVNALDNDAVKRLRSRKNREAKPLAIMVENLDNAGKIAFIGKNEEKLLKGTERPIVLLKRKENALICEEAAPANKRLGIMLPYTPLHYLLFYYLKQISGDDFFALVMTSANLSEEPIVIDNEDARQRLQSIADGFLMHNRDILIRADDSVIFFNGESASFIRRSRGYAPRPVFLKRRGIDLLAVGAELKNTICYLKNDRAFLSQHIGDLQNMLANDFFKLTIEHFKKILEVKPQAVVCDRHPDYFSARWAREQYETVFEIQHHHAHLASVMAEWGLEKPVIGIILDGTGYGYDGTIWGGEVLFANLTRIERCGHLEALPLPGGDSAVKEPWKIAVSYLYHTFGDDLPELSVLREHPAELIVEMIKKNVNSPLTSSCGRLFDAVAAMSGGRQAIRYEGQAAIEMMQAVDNLEVKPYDYSASLPAISIKPIVASIVNDLQSGLKFSSIAARFHKTMIDLFTQIALDCSKKYGVKDIVLSGGVFQNEILLDGLTRSLEKSGLIVYSNKLVPANDGGISLGQALIGQALLREGKEFSEFLDN